jgi:hypothetical protein
MTLGNMKNGLNIVLSNNTVLVIKNGIRPANPLGKELTLAISSLAMDVSVAA